MPAADPALEHVGRRLAQRLVRARDLERDGLDRACVGVVGLAQRLGGAEEEVAGRGHHVGGGVEDRLEQLLVHLPRAADDLLAQLRLAVREVVVDGAERRVRLGHDLLQAGARVSVALKQLGGRLHDPVLGARCHRCSSLSGFTGGLRRVVYR